MGKSTVTGFFTWEEVFENYVLYEHDGIKRLGNMWLGALNTGEPSYTVTLAEISNDAHVRKVLGVEDQVELDELFSLMDKDDDGILTGGEACRYFIADYDIWCKRYEDSNFWSGLVIHWQETGLPQV